MQAIGNIQIQKKLLTQENAPQVTHAYLIVAARDDRSEKLIIRIKNSSHEKFFY